MPGRSIARLAARRTRRSCHGDLGSHWSGNTSQVVNVKWVGARLRPGVRFSSSARGPVIEYATSTSPRLRAASRVDSSGITRNTRVLMLGGLRQYCSLASSTSSTPGLNETNLYGPAPTGAFLKPSGPTCSTYFLGTIHAAPVAGVA